jgi:hypothetical protein
MEQMEQDSVWSVLMCSKNSSKSGICLPHCSHIVSSFSDTTGAGEELGAAGAAWLFLGRPFLFFGPLAVPAGFFFVFFSSMLNAAHSLALVFFNTFESDLSLFTTELPLFFLPAELSTMAAP